MPHLSDNTDDNPSSNPTLDEVIAGAFNRRRALQAGGMVAAGLFITGRPHAAGAVSARRAVVPPVEEPNAAEVAIPAALLGFASVPLNANDTVTVPVGYTARVLLAWGDPVVKGAPDFAFDASQDWKTQALQAGMHHDGLFYFPRHTDHDQSVEGIICVNHEYVDQGLLFPDGMVTWTADKVRKSIEAHGVSVVAVRLHKGAWQVERDSRRNRRITGTTRTRLVGPAAGSPLLRTAADGSGKIALGTLNNCGSGQTPWGTYVTCEENFNGYFGWDGDYTPTAAQNRYGIAKDGFGYRWHEFDPRFNVRLHPNESNRFGWLVEIDPYDRDRTPYKMTACGRFKHESAAFRVTTDGKAVCYSGDDERNNYLYKFVSRDTIKKAKRNGESPLTNGTLYVARFDAGATPADGLGTGEWLALTTTNPALAGWKIDDILVNTRLAADLAGATKLDRTEWITCAPDGQNYVTFTNNSKRTAADEVNPRAATGKGNPYGHIVRWREDGEFDATTFTWDIFVLAGDPTNPAALDGATPGGNVNGDMFGSPDGLWADRDGRIWIQTDISTATLGAGPYVNMPNNMMLVVDPATREIRRFLVGPKGCEITGVCATPDQRAMFVDIQHPGEPANELSDPSNPQAVSNWPDQRQAGQGRPRSATIVITRDDGGIIGG